MSRNAALLKPLCLAVAMTCAAGAHAADWSDTFISYRYISKESAFVTDANNNKVDVAKQIVSLSHISGYKYGSNFFNIDVLKSNSNNPANNGDGSPFGNGPGTNSGAQEVFAIYRHDLSLSTVSGTSLKYGPVKDVTLTAGFNAGSKNDFNGATPLALVIGPTVQFALPAGFVNVGLQAYKESNNSAISNSIFHEGAHQSFKTAPQLNVVWGVPFNAGIPAHFKGFLTVTGNKGRGTPHGDETKTETLMDAMVMFDLGSLAGKKDTFYAGVGYRYWKNKFGNDEALNANNRAGHISAPFVQVEAHF
jgi:nucleoside-specific outer membrane channel protein Tsx